VDGHVAPIADPASLPPKLEIRMIVTPPCHSIIFLTSPNTVGSVSAYSIVLMIAV
jgi:hypothetical protein